MHAEDIKAALRKAGVSMAEIGRGLDVSRAAVGSVVDGKSRSQRVEQAVSDALSLPLSTLWPQWYGGAVASAATVERMQSLDLDLLCMVQQAYWDAMAQRGADPIVPMDAKHLGRLYNRCAEQLARTADTSAKQAVAAREIAYLAQMDHLPRFEAARHASPKFNVNSFGAGEVTTNNVEGGTVKIDMRRKTPRS